MNEFTLKRIEALGLTPNSTKSYYFKSHDYDAIFAYQDRTYELWGSASEFRREIDALESMGFQRVRDHPSI